MPLPDFHAFSFISNTPQLGRCFRFLFTVKPLKKITTGTYCLFRKLYKQDAETGSVLHESCVDSERYGKCQLCGPLIVHPLKELKDLENDLCNLHVLEDFVDDEEQEGREDIIYKLS